MNCYLPTFPRLEAIQKNISWSRTKFAIPNFTTLCTLHLTAVYFWKWMFPGPSVTYINVPYPLQQINVTTPSQPLFNSPLTVVVLSPERTKATHFFRYFHVWCEVINLRLGLLPKQIHGPFQVNVELNTLTPIPLVLGLIEVTVQSLTSTFVYKPGWSLG